MFCQNCGDDISNSGAKFCRSCGTELEPSGLVGLNSRTGTGRQSLASCEAKTPVSFQTFIKLKILSKDPQKKKRRKKQRRKSQLRYVKCALNIND